MANHAPWVHVEAPGGVLLRQLDPSDAAGVFATHADPRVYEHDPRETHPDLAHTRAFLAPMLGHWAEHGFGYWTLLVADEAWSDGVVGGVSRDAGRRIAGLGGVQHHTVAGRPVLNTYFRFAVAAQGRGLGGVVLDSVVRFAGDLAPGVDVVVRTRPANAAALRIAERAGFVDEGLEPGDPMMQLLRLPAPGV